MPKEVWKPVAKYEGFYSVSNLGNVRCEERTCHMGKGKMRKVKSGPIKAFECPRTHYPKVRLYRGDGGKTFAVHILVLTAFIGYAKKGLTCAHKDGNRSNPALKNLRWASQSENEKDKLRHGTHNRGERHYRTKLKERDIIAIRADVRPHVKIGAAYGIGQAQVSRIKLRQRWAHI